MESKTKLLDQMRHVLRLKHMSIRTEKAYVQWAKRFTPISAERNAATIWDETARFLPRKSDDLRRQG